MKKAILINVGNEILKGISLNTNLYEISKFLFSRGIIISKNVVIKDDVEELKEEITKNLGQFEIMIVTGGLGPTYDDITRKAISLALDLKLKFSSKLYSQLKPKFSKYNIIENEILKRYAYIIENAKIIDNPKGIAPGYYIQHNYTHIILLPGPPTEAIAVLENSRSKVPPEPAFCRYLRTHGIMENKIQELCGSELVKVESGLYPSIRGVDIYLQSDDRETLEHISDIIKKKIGTFIYTEELKDIEDIIGEKLREDNLTLSVAESCTGGLLGDLITGVPGSSDYFAGGLITYSNEVKINMLHVPRGIIIEKGAVSPECAYQMVKNLVNLFSTSVGISVTGIAGPTGGTKGKPIGLVYIGIALNENIRVFRYYFSGSRSEIKMKAALEALYLLNLILNGLALPENILKI